MMVNEDFEMLHPGLPLCQKMSEIGLQHFTTPINYIYIYMIYQQVPSIKLEEENRKIPCQPKQVVQGCDRAAGRSVRDPLKCQSQLTRVIGKSQRQLDRQVGPNITQQC